VKVLKNERSGNLVTVEIEEEFGLLEKEFPKAYKQVSKDVKMQGFRPGKIPQKIFENRYGIEVIQERAANNLINSLYPQLLSEEKLDVIDYPSNVEILALKTGEPFQFKLDVLVKPLIKLGKYKGIKITKESSKVSDDDIAEQLKALQDQHASFEEASEGKVEDDNIVECKIEAICDGEAIEKWTKDDWYTKVGTASINEAFDKAIIGVELGADKAFSIDFDAEYGDADLAGKSVDFKLTITKIRRKTLPSFDDALVAKIDSEKTAESYKADLLEKMGSEKEQKAKNKVENDLLDSIIDDTSIDLPDVMIEKEVKNMVHRLEHSLQQSRISLQDYLMYSQKSEDQLLDDYKPQAEKTVKTQLILEAVFKDESLKVEESDIDDEIKKLAKTEDAEELKKFKARLDADMITNLVYYLSEQKSLDFLIKNAKIKEK
jgi:trigger factor